MKTTGKPPKLPVNRITLVGNGDGKEGKSKPVKVYEIRVRKARIRISGTSSLLCCRKSERILAYLEEKASGTGTTKLAPLTPEETFQELLYKFPDSTDKKPHYGFPASGFKKCIVAAAAQTKKQFHKTVLRGALHVDEDDAGLIEITASSICNRRDSAVNKQSKAAIVIYRPEFINWSAVLPVSYNESAITLSEIYNLINIAGFSVGIGAWRPERDGTHGRFEVDLKFNG